jgi:hypothetical protein
LTTLKKQCFIIITNQCIVLINRFWMIFGDYPGTAELCAPFSIAGGTW